MQKKPNRLHLDRRASKLASEARDADPDQLLRTRELADWFGVSVSWVEISRIRGIGPPFVRIAPRMIRYKISSVLRWLEERQRMTTRPV